MDIREVLALNLRKYRQEQGLSQEELAHRAEIDRTYVSALERGVYAASIDVLDRLAQVLGLEAADLLQKPPGKGAKRSQ
ncbi:helix-turn-helix domain-containing protein [Methylovirgula sp. HY1]|uniref:helix-turn-helix domain-containing protein n=1 Tax=Methylovirgula sp. HY1 TaxID=2822761 RepID=UPI001C5ABEFC|nr:helix-turn-helix transcriptional regulator [Methylovirgula sp. HY1]QXX76146.1 HTH-type transcriptional regulator DdrOP3 [Methylovirgula sp. HY1]